MCKCHKLQMVSKNINVFIKIYSIKINITYKSIRNKILKNKGI